ESNALCGGLAISARRESGAVSPRQGRGHDRAQDSRGRRREQYSCHREQGAGARALRSGSGRPGDTERVLPARCRDHLLPAVAAIASCREGPLKVWTAIQATAWEKLVTLWFSRMDGIWTLWDRFIFSNLLRLRRAGSSFASRRLRPM